MEFHQPSVQEPLNETPKKTLEATVESLNNSPPPTDRLQSFPLTSPSLPPHPPSIDDNAGEERGGRVDRRETKPSSSDISVSGSSPPVEPVTDLEKKLRRAERFGMPVQLSEEEKRSSRAERFGVGSASIGKKNTGKLEEEKRKARAERFGLTGQSPVNEEVKKKARLARFEANPKPITPEEEEKRKARTLRFSGTSNAASETIGKANSELKAAVAETGGA